MVETEIERKNRFGYFFNAALYSPEVAGVCLRCPWPDCVARGTGCDAYKRAYVAAKKECYKGVGRKKRK